MSSHVLSKDDAGEVVAELGYTGGLPAELLVDIFSLLPFWDRVRTATVCRSWRSASLEAPGQLWSTIVGPGDVVAPRDLDACSGLLDRARATLITFIILDMYDSNFKELGEMITEHLPHIKALDITLPPHPFASSDATYRVSRGVSSTLQAHAPVLESIRIVNRARMDLKGLSILQSPALNAIELQGLDLSCLRKCAGSRALRTLVIDTDATVWDSSHNWSLVCSFRRLETLAVALSNRDIPDLSDQRRRFPRTLKCLSLSVCTDTLGQITTPRYFSRLDRWHLAFINAGNRQLADLATIMPYLQNITPTVAAVQFDSNSMHFMLVDSAGRRGTAQGVQFNESWNPPLVAATTLCVGGLGMLPSMVIDWSSSFPSLEEITLDVTAESTAFTSDTFKWPRLDSPGLRSVRLRSASAMRKIPLTAVKSLLQDSLAVCAGKLAVLVLDSVHVSAPQGVDVLADLHDLAETVRIQNSGSVWPECHLTWKKPWDEMVR